MERRLLLAGPPIAGNWNLAFNDNFSYINSSVWTSSYWWGGNTGTQATFDPSALSIGANGLNVTATQQGLVGHNGVWEPYTSGVLTTGGLDGQKAPGFSFTYGYIEATSKIAPGQGMWSAIWALPTDHNDNRELDLFENLGRNPYFDTATYHWDGNYFQTPGNLPVDVTAAFHTYGVDWEPDHITWYFDGAPLGTFYNAAAICNRPMYLILNLDVGGPWAGPLNGSSPYQSTWQIQDVRVWQHGAGGGDTSPPSTPNGLFNSAKTTTSATVAWNASSDNVGVAGYNIFRNGAKVNSVAGNVTFYTDTGLSPGTNYSYTVNAYDAAGNVSAASSALGVTTNPGSTGDTTPPSVPASIYSSSTTSNSVAVSWTSSTDNVGVAGYRVYRNGFQVGTTAGNITYLIDNGLAAGTTYSYTVTAFDAAGNTSAPGGPFYVTTLGGTTGDTTPPTAPTALFSSATTASTVAVSWIASSDNIAVTGYNIFRNGAKVGTVAGNYTFLNDTGLTAGTTYTYTVTAFDAAGNNSVASSPFVVTTTGSVTGGPALTQVNLAGAFNNYGIAYDGSTFAQTGGLAGSGTALSANLLGTSQTWNGKSFVIGGTGGNNVIQAAGQTIALANNRYNTLSFLGFDVYGNQLAQIFTVRYTDGTTQSFSQSLSDWFTPQGYAGESNAITVGHINYANGAQDFRSFHVYGYSFALNSSKTVQSITLPNNSKVQILAVNLSNP
jgi:chitodextrinase